MWYKAVICLGMWSCLGYVRAVVKKHAGMYLSYINQWEARVESGLILVDKVWYSSQRLLKKKYSYLSWNAYVVLTKAKKTYNLI
jgi:hypothetical protein